MMPYIAAMKLGPQPTVATSSLPRGDISTYRLWWTSAPHPMSPASLIFFKGSRNLPLDVYGDSERGIYLFVPTKWVVLCLWPSQHANKNFEPRPNVSCKKCVTPDVPSVISSRSLHRHAAEAYGSQLPPIKMWHTYKGPALEIEKNIILYWIILC